MKDYKQKKIIFLCMVVAMTGNESYAKVRTIQEKRIFEQYIAKNKMVVALFYRDEKRNKGLQGKNKDLMKMYEDVSSYHPYNDADVIFLKINTDREALSGLGSSYGVTSTPMFMLIYEGAVLSDDQGKPITLAGFVSRNALQTYIDTYYITEIKERIEIKNEQKKRRLAQENESWKPYFYPRDMFVSGYDPAERDME